MIVDRRESYFIRAAHVRAVDGLEFQRRYLTGLRLLADMRRPKLKGVVLSLRRKQG